MTYLYLLEYIGAIFAIFGAIFMSSSTKENTKPLYYSFISFFIANLFLVAFFGFEGKIPLFIQMILFTIAAIKGILTFTNRKAIDILMMIFVIFIYIVIFIFNQDYVNNMKISWNIELIDTIASFLAIYGAYILSSYNYKVRLFAYVLYLTADIIFIYIGYTNQYYLFLIQSAVFVGTSIRAIINTSSENH